MTTVQITLPDQLAQEAQRAGLLSSAKLEHGLRDQLKTQRVGVVRTRRTPQWGFQTKKPTSSHHSAQAPAKPTIALRVASNPCSTICNFHSAVSV